MDIVLAGIAVVAFAAVILVVTGAFSPARTVPVRIASHPEDEEWMTIEEVAVELDTSPREIMELVERGAVPFYLVPGGSRMRPGHYRFRRDEIKAWTIG